LSGAVADVEVAMVLDRPWLAPVLTAGELVIGGDPAALADLLDLPVASDVVAAEIEGTGRSVRWTELAEGVLACDAVGVAVPAGELTLYDELYVVVRRPVTGRFPVPAWLDPAGRWHAADPIRALLGQLGHETEA